MFSEKEKALEILSLYGLQESEMCWASLHPKRGAIEVYKMMENTNSAFSVKDCNLIFEEVITNNYGSRFHIMIKTELNYPFVKPTVFVLESEINIPSRHRWNDNSLCLFHPDTYSSEMDLLHIRNQTCLWCECAETYNLIGKWESAEHPH